ncbi:unnamed protein product [Peniophora sp. CBMAI 1063]|nr:unnamed protein product [Peniophora sp. CBMAI 1063]
MADYSARLDSQSQIKDPPPSKHEQYSVSQLPSLREGFRESGVRSGLVTGHHDVSDGQEEARRNGFDALLPPSLLRQSFYHDFLGPLSSPSSGSGSGQHCSLDGKGNPAASLDGYATHLGPHRTTPKRIHAIETECDEQLCSAHKGDNDEDSSEDERYGGNYPVCRVREIDQGAGKEPLKEFFSRSGVKLEIAKIPVQINDKKYLKFAQPVPGDSSRWHCVYETMEDAEPTPCGYKSTKHFVKRHIETTHMSIRYVFVASQAVLS